MLSVWNTHVIFLSIISGDKYPTWAQLRQGNDLYDIMTRQL